MEFPLVTVGVPTYNRPMGLNICLEHLLHQSYSNLEIIISDNCSTDPEVQKIILDYAAKDSRIKHFRQSENVGLENNFNFLYAESSAPYFIWMSDDDYFDNDYIEKCVEFLQLNFDYVLCSGIAKYYSGNELLFTEKMFPLCQRTAFKRIFNYFSRVGKNGNFYGVFRRDVIFEKPIGTHVACDWSFMARLSILGKLTFIDTINYYRSAEGNSGTRAKMVKRYRLNKFQNIFFETYIAYTVAINIFKDKGVKNRINYFKRKLLVIMIFFQINWKLFSNFIKRKLENKVN